MELIIKINLSTKPNKSKITDNITKSTLVVVTTKAAYKGK